MTCPRLRISSFITARPQPGTGSFARNFSVTLTPFLTLTWLAVVRGLPLSMFTQPASCAASCVSESLA